MLGKEMEQDYPFEFMVKIQTPFESYTFVNRSFLQVVS